MNSVPVNNLETVEDISLRESNTFERAASLEELKQSSSHHSP